jgi:hypothetical protein
MVVIDPVAASGAIYNLLSFREEYGQVSRVASRFGISRPSLYRIEQEFLDAFARGPGRPRSAPEERVTRDQVNRVRALETENERLRAELERERDEKRRCAERVTFSLIRLGTPARPIARLIREGFGIPANRTGVLQKAQAYGRRATEIMQEHFRPAARDVDLDEIFVESAPLYIAAEPWSMAILNVSKEDRRTAENWSRFLNDMPRLERATSDRGKAILAAISKRRDLIHQSDIFHPKRLLCAELTQMERRCYKLLSHEYKAERALLKVKAQGRDSRGASLRYRLARRKAQQAIDLLDEIEQAVKVAFEAFRFTTSDGRLNSVAKARDALELARFWIQEHLPNGWGKPKRALQDDALLTFLKEFETSLEAIEVHSPSPEDRDATLAALTRLWEDQAHARQRGRPIRIPHAVEEELAMRCSNLPHVKEQLFRTLDHLHRASSAVECINSRVGFYRYSKRRFSTDYANFIAVCHNLSPFEHGKRKGHSPAELLGVNLPTHDLYELFGID